MSHPPVYDEGMIRHHLTLPAWVRRSAFPSPLPGQLVWKRGHLTHRVTAWPELAFETLKRQTWHRLHPDPSSRGFHAHAALIDDAQWRDFLDYLPLPRRELVQLFQSGRLAALVVSTHCPTLVDSLLQTPALLPFVAHHTAIRGTSLPAWPEINAVHERGGLFALLEWLGLPASRLTLARLGEITQPDLPPHSLESLRRQLWLADTSPSSFAQPQSA